MRYIKTIRKIEFCKQLFMNGIRFIIGLYYKK